MNLLNKQVFSFAKIGFLGLGNMGMPMAANLAKNGHQVYGFDVDNNKQSVASQNKINFHNDIKEIAQKADLFVAMLPNSSHSQSVCKADNGILSIIQEFSKMLRKVHSLLTVVLFLRWLRNNLIRKHLHMVIPMLMLQFLEGSQEQLLAL